MKHPKQKKKLYRPYCRRGKN